MEVNQFIRDISERSARPGREAYGFFCECGSHQLSPIELTLDEFDRIPAMGGASTRPDTNHRVPTASQDSRKAA